MAGLLGFEPKPTESKSAMLPLHYSPLYGDDIPHPLRSKQKPNYEVFLVLRNGLEPIINRL